MVARERFSLIYRLVQQTQVDRVVPKYKAFLKAFPTVQKLAKVRQGTVLAAWTGLGYNRRARNLHQLAKQVVRDFGGKLPRTPQALQQLPGIGPYSAAAVACFAFGAPVALVDVNVRRVLGRVYQGVRGLERLSEPAIWKLAGAHVPKQSVAWTSALMDFGATLCTARKPKCATCPLQAQCAAYPKILSETTYQKKSKTPAFTNSDRYWRGRIVATLQALPKKSCRTSSLQQTLRTQGLTPKRFRLLLTRLATEQLVHLKAETVRL